jgi:hypothetical protein
MDNLELEKTLAELKAVSNENNHLLKELHKGLWWSNFFTIIKWIFVIATTVGVYYYFQPLFDQALGSYDKILQSIDRFPRP